MGNKYGGAWIVGLALFGSGVAWAQTKTPAPPPKEDKASTEIIRQPVMPSPLLWFKVPKMSDMATDPDAREENKKLFESGEDDAALGYLLNLYNESPTAAQATTNLALLKRLQHVAKVIESSAQLDILRQLDPVGFEAVARCMSNENGEKDSAGVNVTMYSPRIGEVCMSNYRSNGSNFVKDKTGLSVASIMGQVFGGDTLKLARTYVGDAQLTDTVHGGSQKVAVISQIFSVSTTPTSAGWDYQSFLDRRNNTLIPAIEVTLGASCEKQPTPPLVWDATKFPTSSIDLPEVVLKEAYGDSTACSALKTALASEALKREAAFVMTQIALAQADMTLHPVARDQLAWWQGSLERRIALWEQAEARTGTKFEDVVHSIQDSRFARLRPLLNAMQTPVVP